MAASPSLAGEVDGGTIYRRQCARCHGAFGEGTTEFPRALAGERTPPQLAKLIAKTMPEDDPGTCVGPDSDKVAAFIHETFYSKTARERNKPPRVELSRLTVAQYRNAVADLIGGFRSGGQWDSNHGLKAQYYKNRQFRDNDRVLERVDPQVGFDFGEAAPVADKMEPHEFSIRWEGSVLAPETGEYEFIIRTEHAARLWLNNPGKPLIDAWVKSGNDTEYKATLFLIAGRAYPLKLEFSKAKQGVDDSKKTKIKPKPVKASMALEWKVPHLPAERIPERYLSTARLAPVFVVTTPFPPDDRSIGYERGTTISKAWDQATTEGAIETASYVLSKLNDLADTTTSAKDRPEKLKAFVAKFVERAFRRPLNDEDRKRHVTRHFEVSKDPEAAVKRAVLLALKSPKFLYQEPSEGDAYALASRLSFALWDSSPDDTLRKAAESGKLTNRDELRREAERMVVDLRSKAKVRRFLLNWLRVDPVPDLSKDAKLFPGFDAKLAADLRTSLDLFLDEVVWGDKSDFRILLQDDSVYLNGRLGKLYGVDLPADAAFRKVKLDPKERAGILTHPYLMSTFAYSTTSSPIHRGVFLTRSLLGRSLKPPPEAVAPLAPDLHASLTTRERVTLQTSPAACVTCHDMINPLGFGLEHFDAIGRYRPEEKGKPIDAKGSLETPSGELMPYTGARELAALLADSDEAQGAFVEQLFHAIVKQPVRAYGIGMAPTLKKKFADSGFHIRKLIVEIAVDSSSPTPTPLAPKPSAKR